MNKFLISRIIIKNNGPRTVQTAYHPLTAEKHPISLRNKYRKKHPSFNIKDITRIISVFHELLFEELLNNRQGVFLPKSMGKLFIVSKEVPMHYGWWRKQAYNTDGKLGIVAYDSNIGKRTFTDRSLWFFFMTRAKEKRVEEKYKEDYMFYMNKYKTDSWWNKFVESDGKKVYIPKKKSSPEDGYNEFDFS